MADRPPIVPTGTPPPPVPSGDPERLMTFDEGVELLNMSPRWTWARCDDGTLPHLRLGRVIRFRRSSLLKWLSDKEEAVNP